MKKLMIVSCLMAMMASTALAQESAESFIRSGYLNPSGTFFLGVDESGKNTFMSGTTSGVIGAWNSSLKCWKWRNMVPKDSCKSIVYSVPFLEKYPEYNEGENYGVDANWNFCDSIVANGGYTYYMDGNGDDGYYWQYGIPVQTVTLQDGTTQKFQLLSTAAKPTTSTGGFAVGSLPSGKTSDGLWPLTNAVALSQDGLSIDLFDADSVYYFGSDSVMLPDSSKVQPVKFITHYDKPQAMLYVKNITLALGAKGYSTFHKDKLKVGTLKLTVLDASDNVIATSQADDSDLSNLSAKPGKMLTFKFQNNTTDYGEVLKEGFTVKSAFKVVIEGMSSEDQEFGIYAATSSLKNLGVGSKTNIVYSNDTTKSYTIDYDPYIMLNGIMPELEDAYHVDYGDEISFPVYGDTINLRFMPAEGATYSWLGSYDMDTYTLNTFRFYSSFAPYDTETRLLTMDVVRPDYVTLGVDIEENQGDDDSNPITYWSYKRIFELKLFASSTPKIGDTIKIGKWGKYVVFKITNVNGYTTDPEEEQSADQQQTDNGGIRKYFKNGQVYIQRDGAVYNIFGQKMQ